MSIAADEPVRVLRIIARMNVGGPALQIAGIMRKIPRSNLNQLLVTGYCDGDEIDYLDLHQAEIAFVRIKGLGKSVNLLQDTFSFFRIRNVMRDFDPDIVHTHTAKAGLLGRLASLSLAQSHIRIHTFHGHLLRGYFSGFKLKTYILIERLLAKFTTVIVAVGDQVKTDLVSAKIGDANKYRVIPAGLEINEGFDYKDSLNALCLKGNIFTIAWIGRVVPVKAPHRILEIAAELSKRGHVYRILLAGDGPMLKELQNSAAALNLPIYFFGWLKDISPILAVSDICISTSENEGTPTSLIQAQMSGLPVVATDVGSTSQVVQEGVTGFCLQYSSETFCNRIENLMMDSKLYSALAKSARKRAVKNFSLERLVNDYFDLYQETITDSKS
jgi:glycosyltransferase involved in cell wall biosynthesis